jgi:hypothetical protein
MEVSTITITSVILYLIESRTLGESLSKATSDKQLAKTDLLDLGVDREIDLLRELRHEISREDEAPEPGGHKKDYEDSDSEADAKRSWERFR